MKTELNVAFKTWNGVPIYEKCVKNCHAKNLYSIVLKELENGRLLRMYVAVPGNELFKNNPKNGEMMSVGFHNHRYDIGLQVICGQLTNHLIEEANSFLFYKKYGFETGMGESKLTQPTIVFQNNVSVKFGKFTSLQKGDFLQLKAEELHTISTPKNELVAWLVLEGELQLNFVPKLITNKVLNESSTAPFYKKPTRKEIDEIIKLTIQKSPRLLYCQQNTTKFSNL